MNVILIINKDYILDVENKATTDFVFFYNFVF